MKKLLVALAIATSLVSGSVMAATMDEPTITCKAGKSLLEKGVVALVFADHDKAVAFASKCGVGKYVLTGAAAQSNANNDTYVVLKGTAFQATANN